jgi:hypothetical protein
MATGDEGQNLSLISAALQSDKSISASSASAIRRPIRRRSMSARRA